MVTENEKNKIILQFKDFVTKSYPYFHQEIITHDWSTKKIKMLRFNY